jgi:hypothetical protein
MPPAFSFALICAVRFYFATRLIRNLNLNWIQIGLIFVKIFENGKPLEFSKSLLGWIPSRPISFPFLFQARGPLHLARLAHFRPNSWDANPLHRRLPSTVGHRSPHWPHVCTDSMPCPGDYTDPVAQTHRAELVFHLETGVKHRIGKFSPFRNPNGIIASRDELEIDTTIESLCTTSGVCPIKSRLMTPRSSKNAPPYTFVSRHRCQATLPPPELRRLDKKHHRSPLVPPHPSPWTDVRRRSPLYSK